MNPSVLRALQALVFFSCLLSLTAPFAARSRPGFAASPEETREAEKSNHELIFKIVNFLILAGALGFVLRKPLAEFFTQRSAAIRKSLDEGRKALEVSETRLRAVEQKLTQLEQEIRAFKEAAAQEMVIEHERLRQSTAEEAQKILDSARAQVEASTRAGLVELKVYAAEQALRLAEDLIRRRLDDPTRRRLVGRFVEQLTVGS